MFLQITRIEYGSTYFNFVSVFILNFEFPFSILKEVTVHGVHGTYSTMNRPINNNNNIHNHEPPAAEDIPPNLLPWDENDSSDDDSSVEEEIPTPEEVTVEYTYPQDFHGRRWEDVVGRDAITGRYHFFRLLLDPSCKEIAHDKFQYCSRLIELVVSKNSVLTHIRRDAFHGCTNLQRITNGFPETLLIVEDYAFFYCTALYGRLVIPAKVMRLGLQCFLACSALTSVVFEASTSATVGTPSQTTVVLGNKCFRYCTELQFVRLPPRLITIPHACFEDCVNLTDILIPTSVQIIERRSFRECRNLRSIELSNTIERLGEHAFHNCTSLERIRISVSSSQVQFGANIFQGCSSLSTIQIYPWLYPKLFEAMHDDPSFIFKFFHRYHDQILEETL
jgi:hypothetical protein